MSRNYTPQLQANDKRNKCLVGITKLPRWRKKGEVLCFCPFFSVRGSKRWKDVLSKVNWCKKKFAMLILGCQQTWRMTAAEVKSLPCQDWNPLPDSKQSFISTHLESWLHQSFFLSFPSRPVWSEPFLCMSRQGDCFSLAILETFGSMSFPVVVWDVF